MVISGEPLVATSEVPISIPRGLMSLGVQGAVIWDEKLIVRLNLGEAACKLRSDPWKSKLDTKARTREGVEEHTHRNL